MLIDRSRTSHHCS